MTRPFPIRCATQANYDLIPDGHPDACQDAFAFSKAFKKWVGASVAERLPVATAVGFYFRARVFRIEWARHAAPKPLSIFTTPMFGEHELSMPSNAVMPPKEAP